MKSIKMISLLIFLIPAISFAGVTKKVVERYPPLSSGTTALPGNPRIIVYTDSKGKEIARELCDETGKIVKTTGTIPDGIVKEYYKNGALLADYYYKGSKLEGTSKGYFQDGTLRGEWNYKNGKLDGTLKNYYPNGKIQVEIEYKNDKRDGVTKTYNENGNLTYEFSYKDDEKEGISKSYYANGKIEKEYNYKDGERDGLSKTYYENGKLKSLETYKNGQIVSKMVYDLNGNPISAKGYSNPPDYSVEEKMVE